MAPNFDTIRPGTTQTQGSTNWTQENSQRPMQRSCNDVTQNEHNGNNTATAPGDKRNAETNITGLRDENRTSTQHTSAGYTTQTTKMNRNPNLALHEKGTITALGAEEVNISQKYFGGSPHDPWGRSERNSRPSWRLWTFSESPPKLYVKNKIFEIMHRMARILDTIRPEATQTHGSTNRTRKDSQNPIQQPCNEVTQNGYNKTETVTAPGDESNATINATGPSKDEITRK